MRARRGKRNNNNEAKAMSPVTETDGVPVNHHHGARKAELDGRGRVAELPSQQGLRHEMM